MIRWLTDQIGTAPYSKYVAQRPRFEHTLVDVRELTDREGNRVEQILPFVDAASTALERGQRVVVCCDMGVSRSNTVAMGALIKRGISYDEGLQLLRDKVGIVDVNAGLLRDLRSALTSELPKTVTSGAVMITGARGYIGRSLVERMEEDHQLLCPTREEISLTRDLPLLEAWTTKNNVETIVHLAHPRMRNGLPAMLDAVAMMKNLLDVCRFVGCRFVYLSSLTVFSGYRSFDPLVVSSSTKRKPRGTYGETKHVCEELIEQYREHYGVQATIVRPAGVYGPGMDPTAFMSKFFESAAKDEPIVTHCYQNGRPAFDFVYVDDAIAGIERAIGKDSNGVINLGSGTLVSTYEVAEHAIRVLSSTSCLSEVQLEDTTYQLTVDTEEAERDIGWKATTSFSEGIARVVEARTDALDATS